jgi:uncharacterized protein (DUF1919 family)
LHGYLLRFFGCKITLFDNLIFVNYYITTTSPPNLIKSACFIASAYTAAAVHRRSSNKADSTAIRN